MPANADKVRALHDSLTAQVEALVSGDDWARFLAVAARFHSYSPNNVWLVLAQRPQATRVAGYRTWQRLGRQVNKGAKGIAILAPCVYRRRSVDESELTDNPAIAKILRGFTVSTSSTSYLGNCQGAPSRLGSRCESLTPETLRAGQFSLRRTRDGSGVLQWPRRPPKSGSARSLCGPQAPG